MKHSKKRPLLKGERVRVRPASAILATLDSMGALENLPFNPEMAKLIGKEGVVRHQTLRSCVEGYGIRGFRNTILLEELRCDGAAHDGCQRDCMFFWKEAWLERIGKPSFPLDPAVEAAALEKLLTFPTRVSDRYYCQSTELAKASEELTGIAHWRLMLYECLIGEMSAAELSTIIGRTIINKVLRTFKRTELQTIIGNKGRKSRGSLSLQVKENVRIKDSEAIRETLNDKSKNLGLTFEPEMYQHIGNVYEVSSVIKKMILEETGQMIELKNTVALKDVNCLGGCAKRCPRTNPLFWREAWLERTESN